MSRYGKTNEMRAFSDYRGRGSLIFGLFVVLLSACGLQTTTPTPEVITEMAIIQVSENAPIESATSIPSETAIPVASASPEVVPSETLDPGENPLTGLVVENEKLLDRRPISVKITLYPRSNRPQWGLSFADIVYEYYHNNNLTRFHAIFYGQNADLAGPIRSARLPDEHLMETYGSVLTYASADSRIRDALNNRYPTWRLISILEGICPPNPVCRYDPEAYNHLLANTALLSNYVDAQGGDNNAPDLAGMNFSDQKPKSNYEVERVYTWYSASAYNYWEYQSGPRNYVRYQDAWDAVGGREELYVVLTDRLNNEAITAENVVVLFVDHFHTVYVPASGGVPETEVVDIDFRGRGPAYAFRNGLAYELEWSRGSGEMLKLAFEDGTPYDFKPGNTWFQVVSDSSSLDQDGENWTFMFDFPKP